MLIVPSLVHAVNHMPTEFLGRMQLLAIKDLLDLLEPKRGSSVVDLPTRGMDWWTYVRPLVSGKRKYCATSMAARMQTYCDISGVPIGHNDTMQCATVTRRLTTM
jgi:hypothetical protein